MKKTTKCNETDCKKHIDFIVALSTGACQGCKNVFCYEHKFKHMCDALKQIELQKKQEKEQLLLLAKSKKTFF